MKSPDIPTIYEGVQAALTITQYIQSRLSSKDTALKDDQSPVTVADLAAQVVINQSLIEQNQTVRIVGEEDSSPLQDDPELAASVLSAVQRWRPNYSLKEIISVLDAGSDPGGNEGSFWTLDPIDGTKGFLRGEQYALALARIENGIIQEGFLGCPNLPLSDSGLSDHKIFYAQKGQGAWGLTGKNASYQLSVSSATTFSEARFCESVEKGHSSHSASASIASQLGIQKEPYRIDSQCKYAAVARGDAAIYLRLPVKVGYQEKIWDHAAGVIVVEEAGGRVTDVNGKTLDFSQGRTLALNTGVIVTNNVLHEKTLQAVQHELGLA